MTETRAEKKQRTRQRILEAALALMSQGRSLDSLGLREVARSAGLAATSLYNHFADMDALGLALIDEACFRLRSGMGQGRRALIEEDPAAGLEDLVDRFINYLDQHEAEFRLLMKQRLGNSSLFRRRIQRELELLVEELAEDVRRAGERASLGAVEHGFPRWPRPGGRLAPRRCRHRQKLRYFLGFNANYLTQITKFRK